MQIKLDEVGTILIRKAIKDKVIVQAGYTMQKYQSKNMQMFDLIDRDEFNEFVKKSDYLITHGGIGSILTGLKNNKKVIACPRLFKYREHINDHQVQIVTKFAEDGYILPYNDGDDLGEVIRKLQTFTPKKYVSNTENLVDMIKSFIDNN